MKIVVLNLRKYRYLISTVKIIALMLVVAIIGVALSGAYMRSDKYVQALQNENEKNLVIIDAGHGGEDPGAIGTTGIYEKDLNLQIAYTLGNILSERGFAVLYTRTEDKLLYTEEENIKGIRKISDLKNRCKIAAEYPEAIFISVHMNSYGSPAFSGLQVYYSPENENSKLLASKIQVSVKENLQNSNNRKIKAGKDIYILENVINTAVLIECGFLTNDEECKKLSEKEYQKQLCLAIVCGIIEYKEKISYN